MGKAMRRVGVVTTAFGKGEQMPILRSLQAMSDLGFKQAILVLDVKDTRTPEEANLAINHMAHSIDVYLLEVDEYGTARRWRPGLRKAFSSEPKPPWVLHLPGDLISDFTKQGMEGLDKMCELADEATLVLGDFTSDEDRFKTWFDPNVGSPVTDLLYPDVEERIRQLGLTKRRTEFFCLGREILAKHDRMAAVTWGQDPTIELLFAAMQPSFKIKRVDLGEIRDDPGTRSPIGQAGQIVRFVH